MPTNTDARSLIERAEKAERELRQLKQSVEYASHLLGW